MTKPIAILQTEALELLQQLVRVASFSKEEWETASIITKFLFDHGVEVTRVGNNVLAKNKFFDEAKPTFLLNSHHDTVRPNAGYTRDPFAADIVEGKLFGLGSNDAGGALVSLIAAFLYFHESTELPFNLAMGATAEEEISGTGGIQQALAYLPAINAAIVGEPTQMQLAVAERGLLVLDLVASGKAGHAARNEGENAIYKAVQDIDWLRTYRFEKNSSLLGPVTMNVTSIATENKAHNVVPDQCSFVADIRVNELYTLEEVLATIRQHVKSEVRERSLRMRSSSIDLDHPLVVSGMQLGLKPYGSPTTSDKALMPFPALKMGPGDSARSHTADEFIFVDEVKKGIELYIELLKQVRL